MTTKARDFDKISPTALLTAYARQFSDIPYTNEIAQLTNAKMTVNQFLGQEQENSIVLGLAALIEGRYKAIEQVRERFQGTQILELASGFLPRGMILSKTSEIPFIESDLPAMIQNKQRLVQQLIGDRPNLHFLAINAINDLNPLILKDYFQPNQPVTILCEGLLMYLSFVEKQKIFANVREILQTFGGVWITSDLTTSLGAERMGRNTPAFEPVNQKISSSTGRSFAENEFTDLEHARQFARDQGFQVKEFNMLEVIDQLKSVSALGIDPARVEAMLSALPIFVFTLS